jgi:hypothetical protein
VDLLLDTLRQDGLVRGTQTRQEGDGICCPWGKGSHQPKAIAGRDHLQLDPGCNLNILCGLGSLQMARLIIGCGPLEVQITRHLEGEKIAPFLHCDRPKTYGRWWGSRSGRLSTGRAW